MLMRTSETPAQKAERILPEIDSIFVGGNARLQPIEAAKLIAKGEATLRELEQFIERGESVSSENRQLLESLKISISIAKKE